MNKLIRKELRVCPFATVGYTGRREKGGGVRKWSQLEHVVCGQPAYTWEMPHVAQINYQTTSIRLYDLRSFYHRQSYWFEWKTTKHFEPNGYTQYNRWFLAFKSKIRLYRSMREGHGRRQKAARRTKHLGIDLFYEPPSFASEGPFPVGRFESLAAILRPASPAALTCLALKASGGWSIAGRPTPHPPPLSAPCFWWRPSARPESARESAVLLVWRAGCWTCGHDTAWPT